MVVSLFCGSRGKGTTAALLMQQWQTFHTIMCRCIYPLFRLLPSPQQLLRADGAQHPVPTLPVNRQPLRQVPDGGSLAHLRVLNAAGDSPVGSRAFCT